MERGRRQRALSLGVTGWMTSCIAPPVTPSLFLFCSVPPCLLRAGRLQRLFLNPRVVDFVGESVSLSIRSSGFRPRQEAPWFWSKHLS